MKSNFKKTFLATLVCVGTVATGNVSAATAIKMGTGKVSGSYNTIVCPAIANHVRSSTAGNVTIECVPSMGTGENFDAIMLSGSDTVGLGQLDAYGLKLSEAMLLDEDAEEYMGNIGLMAPEALFCAAKKGGRIPEGDVGFTILTDDEPMEKPLVIATYGENSGSVGTIDFMAESYPAMASNVKMKYKEEMKFDVELGRLRAGKRDAICFVTFPNPEDTQISQVAESDDLFFIEFGAESLRSLKIGDVPAYQVQEVNTSGSILSLFGGGTKVKTIVTGITLMLNVDELDGASYDALVNAVNDPELIPADTTVGKLARWQAKAMGAAMEAYQVAKEKTGN